MCEAGNKNQIIWGGSQTCQCTKIPCFQQRVLTLASGLTDGFAGLAGVGVPRYDLDLDAVLGQVVQVRQSKPVLLDVADVSGLKEAAEGW